MKKWIFLIAPVVLLVMSCSKSSNNDAKDEFGTLPGTWTFTAENRFYEGYFAIDSALMDYSPTQYNTYDIEMLGIDKDSKYNLILGINVDDANLTPKTYQTGIDNPDLEDAFVVFDESISMLQYFYESRNNDPGPIMNFTIKSYNEATKMLIIEFSGEVKKADGTYISVTKGKLTIPVSRV